MTELLKRIFIRPQPKTEQEFQVYRNNLNQFLKKHKKVIPSRYSKKFRD